MENFTYETTVSYTKLLRVQFSTPSSVSVMLFIV